LSGTGLDLLPLRGAESLDDVVYVGGHWLIPFLLQSVEMGIKSIVGLGDELSVKPLLAHSGFVARHQQNGLALWVECESNFRHLPR
jgi:hypothetical protein